VGLGRDGDGVHWERAFGGVAVLDAGLIEIELGGMGNSRIIPPPGFV
jgi:hypothetical protein